MVVYACVVLIKNPKHQLRIDTVEFRQIQQPVCEVLFCVDDILLTDAQKIEVADPQRWSIFVTFCVNRPKKTRNTSNGKIFLACTPGLRGSLPPLHAGHT